MEIIRAGSKQKVDKIKRFECIYCGAIWTATKGEYKYATQYNESYYYCTCPYCGKTATV